MSLAALGGSTTPNSYLTVLEGDLLSSRMLGTMKWDTSTQSHKEAALIQATRFLDTMGWVGSKAAATQPLAWPRKDAKCGDKDYTSTVIPTEVEQATFDLAEGLLNNPGLITGLGSSSSGGGGSAPGELVPGVPNATLRSLQLDVMRLEFKDNASSSATTVKTPLTVMPHLALVLGCLTTSTVGSHCLVARVRS